MLGSELAAEPGILRVTVERSINFLLQERQRVGVAVGDGTLGSNRDHGFIDHLSLLIKPYWQYSG
jgi:hypothetical protein